MSTRPLDPLPPFVWPEPRVLAGQVAYAHEVPFRTAAESSSKWFGVIHGLDRRGAEWLSHAMRSREDSCCRLLLSLYPACATSDSDLQQLCDLKMELADRVDFRLALSDLAGGHFSSTLGLVSGDGNLLFALGPTGNFGLTRTDFGQVNLVFKPDGLIFDAWRKWFDLAWETCVPLTQATAQIPALIPAEGDPEAAALWQEYHRRCQAAKCGVEDSTRAEVDPESGNVRVVGSDGQEIDRASKSLGVPQLDKIGERVARIFEMGEMATIDRTSRIPPLDAPFKAKWVGRESRREVGAISEETKFRIALLDRQTLKAAERKRTTGSDLLRRLSFQLGGGVRWVPAQAKPLLERELERVNKEGHDLISNIAGDKLDDFVESKREAVKRDANAIYQEIHPGASMPKNVIDEILEDLKQRLKKARLARFLPTVIYSSVRPAFKQSSWSSEWGQSLTLLYGIAEFPRNALTDRFLLAGLELGEDEYMTAMDVCGDYIVGASRTRNMRDRARADLDCLKTIMGAEVDGRVKCEAILDLMGGIEIEHIEQRLQQPASKSAAVSTATAGS